ncbi:hypothetical protein EKI60_01100 [Candidatus Saccharibacteria bacterium]|nr:MAG: hypothetical protein EKI60_01100 [Candidatus Saccharibacteria bacterium]
MTQLIPFLVSIGLSKTEATIYLAAMQKKTIGVDELLKIVDVKRPAIYPAVRNLVRKGLVTTATEEGKLVIAAKSKERIQAYLSDQTKIIEQQSQTFTHLQHLFPEVPSEQERPAIQLFNDIGGIKQVVEKALECKDRKWRIIAPKQNFFSEFDREFADYFIDKRAARNIQAKSLWEAGFRADDRPLSLQEIALRRPRFLPLEYTGKFSAVIIIFDDYVASISSLKGHHAVLVKSSEMTKTMNVMFDALWQFSHSTTR